MGVRPIPIPDKPGLLRYQPLGGRPFESNFTPASFNKACISFLLRRIFIAAIPFALAVASYIRRDFISFFMYLHFPVPFASVVNFIASAEAFFN